ncbi:hypothetical protein [Streptomyces sp. NRRL WC-3742]|uniref:hypothetical protein n=1 Tax=Streptomyces sp. NRRL WC-3742 TaxID=1463934 RepID=UPI0004CC6677|nr:hypothetical protein [Streptomyces sp. NRRL WC-3742]
MTTMAGPAAAQSRTTHRGSDACFNWSWDDSGWWTTTVYWHNTCSERRKIKIVWKWSGLEPSIITVDGDGKGHEARRSEPEAIYDAGAA